MAISRVASPDRTFRANTVPHRPSRHPLFANTPRTEGERHGPRRQIGIGIGAGTSATTVRTTTPRSVDASSAGQRCTWCRCNGGDDRARCGGVARGRRHRDGSGNGCCSPAGRRVRPWRCRVGAQRLRRVDRTITDDALVAGHRIWRKRRAVRVHRGSLRLDVAGTGLDQQLPRCRLLRDGRRGRPGRRVVATRPGGVGCRRNGTGGSIDVELRRRPGGAVWHRRVRCLRRRVRRVAAAVTVGRRRVHASPAGGGELRGEDVRRGCEPQRCRCRVEARTGHRRGQRIGRRVLRAP